MLRPAEVLYYVHGDNRDGGADRIASEHKDRVTEVNPAHVDTDRVGAIPQKPEECILGLGYTRRRVSIGSAQADGV